MSTFKEKSGDFLLDLAKLIIGGVVLAGIMERWSIPNWLLFGTGGVIACFLVLWGLMLFKLNDKENRKEQ